MVELAMKDRRGKLTEAGDFVAFVMGNELHMGRVDKVCARTVRVLSSFCYYYVSPTKFIKVG